MKIADIIRQPAVTIPVSASIATAAQMMREWNVGILTVLDHDRLVGVITDRDIVVRFVTGDEAAMHVRVGDVMSPKVLTCFDSQTIEDAAAAMGDHQVRRLPVCDEAKRLLGVLSVDRIAEEYSEHLAGEALGEIVEKRGVQVTKDFHR